MGIKFINMANERIGGIGKNKFGSIMEVVEYNNANDIWVKFEKGNLVHTTWDCFQIGEVKNPYDRSIYGVGFIGEGEHKPNVKCEKTLSYQIWISMFQRCYDEKFKEKHPTYKDCIVCDKWLNFQNFGKWFDQHYYEIEGERMNLDKDILIKGNKVYSPDTCVFVPQKINLLFIKNDSIRGDLPIGVHFEKQTNKYKAQCKINKGKVKNLGRYNTAGEAFNAYKKFKGNYIKEIAEEYKDKIPEKLYDVMITYKVEIVD